MKFFILLFILLFFYSCKSAMYNKDKREVVVSVPDQRIAVFEKGKKIKTFPISTSKFGIGNEEGSYKTPIGEFLISEKIGYKAPKGSVFKSRMRTGEIVKPNQGGRDTIVTRVLRLEGLDEENKNAKKRCIYIHGTVAERKIGKPASYGCIRMKSTDVIKLFKLVPSGTPVNITLNKIRTSERHIAMRGSNYSEIPHTPFEKLFVPQINDSVVPNIESVERESIYLADSGSIENDFKGIKLNMERELGAEIDILDEEIKSNINDDVLSEVGEVELIESVPVEDFVEFENLED